MIETNYDRKILSPGESINALTIGSNHFDEQGEVNLGRRKDLLENRFLLSPISRIGFGINKSVKPDLLMPGGRQLYRLRPMQPTTEQTKFSCEPGYSMSNPPGTRAAMTGSEGEVNRTGYLCGTSGSTALATRLGGKIYEMLIQMNAELPDDRRIPHEYFTVIIKCLLIHGSAWNDAQSILATVLSSRPGINPQNLKRNISSYLGYGTVDENIALRCSDHSVTLIGFAKLTPHEGRNAHIYSMPLPPALSGRVINKKVIISLAWLTPINFKTSEYRKAHLYFDNIIENSEHIALQRTSYDYKLTKKGTVQHDILEGSYADVFQDGDFLKFKVNCRSDASDISSNEPIRYAVAVTLQIPEGIVLNIYDQIAQRLALPVRPRV